MEKSADWISRRAGFGFRLGDDPISEKELFEQRDLRQTTDARDVYGDVIHHAFNISKQNIKDIVFPGTQQKLNLDIWG